MRETEGFRLLVSNTIRGLKGTARRVDLDVDVDLDLDFDGNGDVELDELR